MSAYYNEHDRLKAAWLRQLMADGLIAPGDVDERSITDVQPTDLAEYTQCHFFAGIGVWSYALRLAGWPDDRPVWTGSCPCQPFSVAGKGDGHADSRHLWPSWFPLIRECRPVAVFGEQVEAALRHGWFDLVSADLEDCGYAVGALGLNAASVGAPHIRQRVYFVADASNPQRRQVHEPGCDDGRGENTRRAQAHGITGTCGEVFSMAHPQIGGLRANGGSSRIGGHNDECGTSRKLAHSSRAGLPYAESQDLSGAGRRSEGRAVGEPSHPSFWSDCDWLPCRDGKYRPTQPGVAPLVAGAPRGVVPGGDTGLPIDPNATVEARVMRLRGYGDAIVAQVAETFIRCYMDGCAS